jgi:hypothetical protein
MKSSYRFGLLILSAMTLFSQEPKPRDSEEFIKVTVAGTIRTGVVAIGGETTGVTIKSKNATFELEFGKNSDLRKQADLLNGTSAIVEGALDRRSGTEVKERWIITVTAVSPASGTKN